MTHDQIEVWAKAGESETLEFKQTTGERREGTRALCAMLNHCGGRVLYGLRPDRTVAGQQVSDRTLEDLAQEIKRLDPPAFPTIDRVQVTGTKKWSSYPRPRGRGGRTRTRGKRISGSGTPALR